MKTQTRSKILKLIEKNGAMRPDDLRQSLDISSQAVHRHLKSLVEKGLVEAKGSAPFTRYALAGVPDFETVSSWIKAPVGMKNPGVSVCETRDAFSARLPHLREFVKDGLPETLLPLVISTAGEIGNNSFDHNLGQWRDISGCWFESQVTGRCLYICIADRGQGIFHSLAKVHPHLTDDQSAIRAAFETIISGRAPEQRGNGLKFVKNSFERTPGSGLACLSGTGKIAYGDRGEKTLAFLNSYFKAIKGTVTVMAWRLE